MKYIREKTDIYKALLIFGFVFLFSVYNLHISNYFGEVHKFFKNYLFDISKIFFLYPVGLLLILIGIAGFKKDNKTEIIKHFLKPTKGKIAIFLFLLFILVFFITIKWPHVLIDGQFRGEFMKELSKEGQKSELGGMFILWFLYYLPLATFGFYFFLNYIFSCFVIWVYEKTNNRYTKFLFAIAVIIIFSNLSPFIGWTVDYIQESHVREMKEISKKTINLEDAVNACREIPERKESNECIADIAIKRRDISICEKFIERVETGYQLDSCYAKSAMELNDTLTCSSIKSGAMRSVCYTRLAVINNDYSICELIEYKKGEVQSLSKSVCIKYVEKGIIPPERWF